MSLVERIGMALRFVRLSRDMGQGKLALKIGVSDSFVSLIELGKRQPSLDTLEKLCNALNVSLTLLAMIAESEDPFVQPIAPLAYMELARSIRREKEIVSDPAWCPGSSGDGAEAEASREVH